MKYIIIGLSLFTLLSCGPSNRIEPILKTETVPHDSDDPAIWIHPTDLGKSLIIGTDKHDTDGGVYVFDLRGKRLDSLSVRGLRYPNNIDIAYGFTLGYDTIDIAVSSEREAGKIRVYSLPDMQLIDNGGLDVFEGEKPALRRPMGVALHKNPETGAMEVFVSRKQGPSEGYLGHYEIFSDSKGVLAIKELRKFGRFATISNGEIEAIAVDDESQTVFYSDEACCIRAYSTLVNQNEMIQSFGENDFTEDREGIAILNDSKGNRSLVVSNQQEFAFNIYPIKPNDKVDPLHKIVYLSTYETDGCELSPLAFPGFPNGLFVAMSDDRTFHLYDLEEVMKGNLNKE